VLTDSGRGERSRDFPAPESGTIARTGFSWETARKVIDRVKYEGTSHSVSVTFQDGTRMEYTYPRSILQAAETKKPPVTVDVCRVSAA